MEEPILEDLIKRDQAMNADLRNYCKKIFKFLIFFLFSQFLLNAKKISEDDVSLSGNWSQSNWFGTYCETDSSWIYHVKFGWVYLHEISPENHWIYISNNNFSVSWLWLHKDSYPYFYDYLTKSWLYFSDESGEAKFYHFNYRKWYSLKGTNWNEAYYVGGAENFTILEEAKKQKLEKLHLSNFRKEGIEKVNELTDIELLFLDFNTTEKVDLKLEELAGLNNLKRLFILGATSTDLTIPSSLLGLEEIYIKGEMSNVESLGNLENLVELKLDFPPDKSHKAIDFTFLQNLKNLETLRIKGRSLEQLGGGWKDIYPNLQNLNGLKEIILTGFPDPSLDAFEGLTDVESISIHIGPEEEVNLSSLSSMKNLHSLGLECHSVKSFSPLESTNLARFWLSCDSTARGVPDLSPMASIDSLGGIRLSASPEDTFEGMDKLSNIYSLRITSEVRDLSVFGNLENIVELELGQTTDHDLSPLSELTNLVTLSLGNLSKISDLSPLASLQNLRILRIQEVDVIDKPIILKDLPELDRFKIYRGNYSVEEIWSMQSHLPMSQSGLSYFPPSWSWARGSKHEEPSDELLNLKIEEARVSNVLNLSYSGFSNLETIPPLPELERLILDETSIVSINSIGKFPKLKYLSLFFCDDFDHNMSALAELDFIERVDVNPDKSSYFQTLPHLSSLNSLEVVHYDDLNLSFFDNTPNIERLYLETRFSNFEELESLAKLKSLTWSSFSSYNTVIDLSVLTDLKQINHLEIFGSFYMQNFSSIAELENLESLTINGELFLYDLSPLHSLKKLKFLSLHSSNIVGYREKQRLWEKLPEIKFIDSWISLEDFIMGESDAFPHQEERF